MNFMKNWSVGMKRDVAFVGLTIFLLLGIWSPAWDAPVWQSLLLYLLAVGCLVPAITYGREIGFDSLALALVPAVCVGVIMFGSLAHFVWEFFLRY